MLLLGIAGTQLVVIKEQELKFEVSEELDIEFSRFRKARTLIKDSKQLYGFELRKNKAILFFYTEDRAQIKLWLQIIKLICIKTNI